MIGSLNLPKNYWVTGSELLLFEQEPDEAKVGTFVGYKLYLIVGKKIH